MLIGTGWTAYLGLLGELMSVAALIAVGIVLSWVVGREFTDGTVGALLALPTTPGQILRREAAGHARMGGASGLAAALVAVPAGLAVGLGAPDSGALAATGQVLVVMALMTLLALPLAWVSTVLRGYLSGIATLLGIVVVTQIVTISGAGGWFPYAAPSLWTGMGGAEAAATVTPVQLMLACRSAWSGHGPRRIAGGAPSWCDGAPSSRRGPTATTEGRVVESRRARRQRRPGLLRRGGVRLRPDRGRRARRRRRGVLDDDVAIFTHTEIAPEFGGRGSGSVLMGRALADVAAQGLAVVGGPLRRSSRPTSGRRGTPTPRRQGVDPRQHESPRSKRPRASRDRQTADPKTRSPRPAWRRTDLRVAARDRPVTISLPVRMDVRGAVRRPPELPRARCPPFSGRPSSSAPCRSGSPHPASRPRCRWGTVLVPFADGSQGPWGVGSLPVWLHRLVHRCARVVLVSAHRPVDEICGRWRSRWSAADGGPDGGAVEPLPIKGDGFRQSATATGMIGRARSPRWASAGVVQWQNFSFPS